MSLFLLKIAYVYFNIKNLYPKHFAAASGDQTSIDIYKIWILLKVIKAQYII